MIVEAAVAGREIECGVLAARGGGLPEASLPAEIRLRPGADWYDFAAKYLDDAVDFDVPADLDARSRPRPCRTAARRAYLALDCQGLARVDFFLGTAADGSDRLVINEVNTMPGLHADLDVPADVGGQRGGLPRAGRPAGRRRALARRLAARSVTPGGCPRAPGRRPARPARACLAAAPGAPAPSTGRRRRAPARRSPGSADELGCARRDRGAVGAAPAARRRSSQPPAGPKRSTTSPTTPTTPAHERDGAGAYGYRFGWERFWGTGPAPMTGVFVDQFRDRARAPAPTPRTSPRNEADVLRRHRCARTRRELPGGCRMLTVDDAEPAAGLRGPAAFAWCGHGVVQRLGDRRRGLRSRPPSTRSARWWRPSWPAAAR